MSAGWTNYSVAGGDDDGPVSVGPEDQPACASCKKRKLRCSRELPICSHCSRLSSECVYQPKQKPGLKPGAVEALTRRVALLEKILLDETGNIRSQYNVDDELQTGRAFQHRDTTGRNGLAPQTNENINHTPSHHHHSDLSVQGSSRDYDGAVVNSLKRRHESPSAQMLLFMLDDMDIAQHLPPQSLLEKVVDFFCISFHHWTPFVHKKRLQTRVRDGARDAGFHLVLHAMVAITLRHMDSNALFMDQDEIHHQTKLSRIIVETHAIRSVSVESLQALAFLVFDHLNDGQIHRAWPLIGSLTRTIDYLQLTTEPSASQSGSLMMPIRLVQPSNDWTELEERRRLFWIIFLLDRFCSVSTGWNTSLTADDVHRRLPADGGYFTREEPVTTPFFGIWNKAAARIGRSLANVPAQYNEEDPTIEQPPGKGASPNSANGYIDASKLGAFAYCVEATESLSQVTTFFLQQRINWQDKGHAISWLTRFKELDLRLVNWKVFLPPRWKDSNISSDTAVIDMDPNLTLAHITHNTSMILLHHPIAHPPSAWKDYVALPKECSAQTCVLAAVETSNIVDKFLAHTSIPFVNAQFAFCAFVAAKALLFDFQATGQQTLRQEFQRLTRDLRNMSKRWRGPIDESEKEPMTRRNVDQAGNYAACLEHLLETCAHDAHFKFDFYDHSGLLNRQSYTSPTYVSTPTTHQRSGSNLNERALLTSQAKRKSFHSPPPVQSPRRVLSTTAVNHTEPAGSTAIYEQRHGSIPTTSMLSPLAASPMYATQPAANSYHSHGHTLYNIGTTSPSLGSRNGSFPVINGAGRQHSVHDQSLLNLSDAFMDSQFLDMDRVITFEDANFLLPGDEFRW